jgi:tetratricopeptide (TPR) repeat protein
MARAGKAMVLSGVLALAALAVYANHFGNAFHFDDMHAVANNIFIRDLRNVPRFFTSATYFSTLPDHRTYRPLVSASLALDYRLGGGLKPFWFQLSTFLWYVVLVTLVFFLYRRIMDSASPQPSNLWTAFFAALCYALHPVNAETVNYVIQRGDLYATLGTAAGLACFAAWPEQRKYGWYLLPAMLGYLSKPTALVFPAILLFYILLFEQEKWGAALRAALPALAVTVAFAVLHWMMLPASFNAGAQSPWLYRISQPYVALHYFKSFFLPTELSADTDWGYIDGLFSTKGVMGFGFVAAVLAVAKWTSRKRETRPIAFGLLWFVITLLPTSLMPLAEVTNDHRMFFPLVGLVLAVFWGVRLLIAGHPGWAKVALAGLAIVLAAEAVGTHARNEVWRTDESLWRDVTVKSPRNGRGLMNYGLTLMARGDYAGALSYFERAQAYTPNYPLLEINLGIASGGLQRDADAQRHFGRAIALAANTAEPYYYFAVWLHDTGRLAQSAAMLETAVARNPLSFDSRHLLLQVHSEEGNLAAAGKLARETLQLAPNDDVAQRYATRPAVQAKGSAEELLDQSRAFYQSKQYFECILSAMKALKLQPDLAEAYNNIAAANNAMGRWDQGIKAAHEALRLQPDFALARENLRWAEGQRKAGEEAK